jgi:hypothetical protein
MRSETKRSSERSSKFPQFSVDAVRGKVRLELNLHAKQADSEQVARMLEGFSLGLITRFDAPLDTAVKIRSARLGRGLRLVTSLPLPVAVVPEVSRAAEVFAVGIGRRLAAA